MTRGSKTLVWSRSSTSYVTNKKVVGVEVRLLMVKVVANHLTLMSGKMPKVCLMQNRKNLPKTLMTQYVKVLCLQGKLGLVVTEH